MLIIGDFLVHARAGDLPCRFRELLNTDKIRHVFCTGNLGTKEVWDHLKSLAPQSNVHVVKGDADVEPVNVIRHFFFSF